MTSLAQVMPVDWFRLVAAQGSVDDVRWLLDVGIRIDARPRALEALDQAPRPETMEILTTEFRDGRGNPYALERLAKAAPREVPAIASAILLSPVQAHDLRKQDVLQLYARHAPVDRLDEVEALLRAQTGDEDRIAAVHGVEALRKRGRDVSSLSSVSNAAIEFVERVGAGEVITDANRFLLSRAGYAIEYNEGTWSERAASALERAADALDRAGIKVGGPEYRPLATKIRDGLKSQWK